MKKITLEELIKKSKSQNLLDLSIVKDESVVMDLWLEYATDPSTFDTEDPIKAKDNNFYCLDLLVYLARELEVDDGHANSNWLSNPIRNKFKLNPNFLQVFKEKHFEEHIKKYGYEETFSPVLMLSSFITHMARLYTLDDILTYCRIGETE